MKNEENIKNMNMLLDLSVLQLLPEILKEIQTLRESIELIKPNLTSLNDVLKFLNLKSRSTIYEYIEKGIFVEDVHYRKVDGRISYIAEGIIEFKRNGGMKGKKKIKVDDKLDDILERMSA